MNRYAVLNDSNVVVNVIVLNDINDFNSTEYTVVQSDIADIGGTIIDDVYIPPEGLVYIPTESDLVADAQSKMTTLLTVASEKIAPLQDAVDLDIATADEITSLAAWKTYRVAVNRIPTQLGYPSTIDWPEQPL